MIQASTKKEIDRLRKKVYTIENDGLYDWIDWRSQVLMAVDAYEAEETAYNRELVDNGIVKRAQLISKADHLCEKFECALKYGMPRALESLAETEPQQPEYSDLYSQFRGEVAELVVEMDAHAANHHGLVEQITKYLYLANICCSEGQLDEAQSWVECIECDVEILRGFLPKFAEGRGRAQVLLYKIWAARDYLECEYAAYGRTPEQVRAAAEDQLENVQETISETRGLITQLKRL